MTIQELKKIIPEAEVIKDNFGADYFYIPASVLSKRKAWNLYLKRGFLPCANKQYLKKGNIYLYNSTLKNYLIVEVANE
jgi:hypothetical protein